MSLHPSAGAEHWRHSLRLTTALLLVWGALGFGVTYFARELSFVFFGWPFSFWVAAQGAPLFFILIIWFYALVMNRLDRRLEQRLAANREPD